MNSYFLSFYPSYKLHIWNALQKKPKLPCATPRFFLSACQEIVTQTSKEIWWLHMLKRPKGNSFLSRVAFQCFLCSRVALWEHLDRVTDAFIPAIVQSDLPESSLEQCKHTAFPARSSSLAPAPHKPENKHVERNQRLGSVSHFACIVCRRKLCYPPGIFLSESQRWVFGCLCRRSLPSLRSCRGRAERRRKDREHSLLARGVTMPLSPWCHCWPQHKCVNYPPATQNATWYPDSNSNKGWVSTNCHSLAVILTSQLCRPLSHAVTSRDDVSLTTDC